MALSKILVATDFSRAAQRAVERAAHLAKQACAELRLIHVLPDPGIVQKLFAHGGQYPAMLNGAEHALRSAGRSVERAFDIEPTWEVLTGSAERTIGKAAEAFSADLLVIGAEGENKSRFSQPSIGGTALKLIAHSKVPLLLVRRPVQAPYCNTVLAADSEETARRILDLLQWLADQGQCHLLHAFEAPFAPRLKKLKVATAAIETYARQQRSVEDEKLQRLAAESPLRDRLQTVLVRGDAMEVVLGEIKRLAPELVAIGKHEARTRGSHSAQAGGVALRIILGTRCDILQVP